MELLGLLRLQELPELMARFGQLKLQGLPELMEHFE